MRNRSIRRLVGSGLLVGGLTMGALAAPASSGAAQHPKASTTLTVAEPAQSFATSNYPYYTVSNCTTADIDYWNLSTRPGEWFGLGPSIALQPQLSMFNTPTFGTSGGNTTVTVTIKPWMWTDGAGHSAPVDNSSVAQFLNIDKATTGVAGGQFCGYVPHYGIPDGVVDVTYNGGLSGHSFTITFQGKASQNWVINNQISQIVPLAPAWDTTDGSTSAGCAAEPFNSITDQKGGDTCGKVYTYMSKLTMQSPLWQWSDGPYRQASAQYASGAPTGLDVMQANTGYSDTGFGAHAAQTVDFIPETSTTAEISQLQKNKVGIGYVDPTDLARAPGPGKIGKNLLPKMTNYTPEPGTLFATFYWEYNFDNANSTYQTKGPLPVWAEMINNAYIRADIQQSIDQVGIINHVDNGYAIPAWSAVPAYPKTSNSTGIKNPYPYSKTKGKAQMKANGWNVKVYPAVCAKSGAAGCGTTAFPIKKGSKAQIQLMVPAGDPSVKTATQDTVTEVKQAADIQIIPQYRSAATYIGPACFGGAHPWELCGYGGWIYAPDYYPTGEVLFGTGAGSNVGGYSSSEMTGLINGTLQAGFNLNQTQPTYGTSYAEWTAQNLPFSWQPVPTSTNEYNKALKGCPVPNPLVVFNPEFCTAVI